LPLLLEVKGLKTGYPQKPLVDNLSFEINKPAFIAIIGHNGSGKTTFLKSLVNQHLYQGEIFVNGKEIKSIQNITSQGYITLLEQKNSVNFSIPVKDLLVMGRFRNKSFFQDYDQVDYSKVSEVLKTLNLSHLENQDFLNLSGGEQQLIWLAQIMIQETDIVLLDEPTQQLDVYNKKKVFALMQQWVKEKGRLVLCITHDITNLYDMEGYILNLALDQPKLQTISIASVKENLQILESSFNVA
jgi:iron complex transport system ATP-binding protein